ncbi:20209_t:CDS:2, partial [Gigaspora rosea]
FLQQPQAMLTSSRSKPYQALSQNIQYQNHEYWKALSTPLIICFQHLQPYFQTSYQTKEKLYSLPVPTKKNEIIKDWKKEIDQENDNEPVEIINQDRERLQNNKPELVLNREALKSACEVWVKKLPISEKQLVK